MTDRYRSLTPTPTPPPRSQGRAIVAYRATYRPLADGAWEVVAVAWASENGPVMDGWNLAGTAMHRNREAAESIAVKNLARTMADNGIRAACVPARD